MKILEDCWDNDNEWTKTTVDHIKAHTKLTEAQIYKWGYDQKRKQSCKDGIRNMLREQKRRKMGESETSDYNTMVDLLFPDVEVVSARSDIRLDLTSELPYSEFSGSSQHSKSVFTGLGHQNEKSTSDEKIYTLELVKSAPVGILIGFENDFSEYNNTTLEDNKFTPRGNPAASDLDILSHFGDISDENDRKYDFE